MKTLAFVILFFVILYACTVPAAQPAEAATTAAPTLRWRWLGGGPVYTTGYIYNRILWVGGGYFWIDYGYVSRWGAICNVWQRPGWRGEPVNVLSCSY